MMAQIAQVQKKMLEGSDYVGDRFADEARAIHEPARRIPRARNDVAVAVTHVAEGVDDSHGSRLHFARFGYADAHANPTRAGREGRSPALEGHHP